MRLGIVARGDNGGLATMTGEAARHLHPERVLLIDLGDKGRGACRPERFPGAMVNRGMDHELTPETVRHFAEGLDVIYMAETSYADHFCDTARSVGARTVLHAMPELMRRDYSPPDAVWLPTTWEAHRLPGATVVPVPVARDRLAPRLRSECRTFLHVAGTKFHDRNGTRLTLAATRRMTQPCRLVVHGWTGHLPDRLGRVMVERHREANDYWQIYPSYADVLVMPRRYAGLSLPVQEAASLGMGLVMLDLPPYNGALAPESLVATRGPGLDFPMGGGTFTVHNGDVNALAARMDEIVRDPALCERLSKHSDTWAESLSWYRWAPRYRDLLAEVA